MPIDFLAKNGKMTVKKMTEKRPVKSLHTTYVVKCTSVLMRSEWQTKYSGVNWYYGIHILKPPLSELLWVQ